MEYLTFYKCGICGEVYDSAGGAKDCEKLPTQTDFYSFDRGCHVTVFDGYKKGHGVLTGKVRYDLLWDAKIHIKRLEVKFDRDNHCRFVPCHYIIPKTGA